MKLTEIQDLIKFVAKSGVSEVELENGDFKITIKTPATPKRRGAAAQQPIEVPPAAYVHAPVAAAVPAAAPPAPAPAPAPAAAAPAPAEAPSAPAEEAKTEDTSNYITIKSPMIGTFYRRPSPDKPIFINVGDEVTKGQVVCIIEAMKLFNEIEAEVSGKVVKVLADDNTPVEFDQPLFLIDPS